MGNAVTDDYRDYIGTFEYWWTHGLISDATYHNLRATCILQSSEHPSEECVKNLNTASAEEGNIDPYSIYTQPCNNTSSLKLSLNGRYVSSLRVFLLFFKGQSRAYFINLFLLQFILLRDTFLIR